MSDRFTAQLSAYIDGELDDLSRARLESHLAECLDCTRTVAELRAIVAAAPDYRGREPSRDLWNDIERRLDEPEVVPINPSRPAVQPSSRPTMQPSRHRFGWRALIAASIVMAAVGGGAVWVALDGTVREVPTAAAPAPITAEQQNVEFADREYDAAIQDLELLLARGQNRLDSATIRTIEQSLSKIDEAITEARAAVQRDPANAYLSRQIAANMRRKLNLLRVATQAIAART